MSYTCQSGATHYMSDKGSNDDTSDSTGNLTQRHLAHWIFTGFVLVHTHTFI